MTLPRARRPLLIFTPVERKRTTAVVEKRECSAMYSLVSKECMFRFLTIPSQMEVKMAMITAFGYLILTPVTSLLLLLHGSQTFGARFVSCFVRCFSSITDETCAIALKTTPSLLHCQTTGISVFIVTMEKENQFPSDKHSLSMHFVQFLTFFEAFPLCMRLFHSLRPR